MTSPASFSAAAPPGVTTRISGAPGIPARRGMVRPPAPPRPDIAGAEARVHVFEIDVLHIAGIDALISGCNRERGLRVVARLEREPLRQSKMHIALECCGMR